MSLNDRIAELGIGLYQGTREEDYAVAELFENIDFFGEMEKLLAESARTLSEFFKLIGKPSTTFYTVEGGQIESIHWAQPVYTTNQAVFLSSWWLPGSRGTRRHIQVISVVYQMLFSAGIQLVLSITKQEKIAKQLEKAGSQIHGPIPGLFDDQLAWLTSLTEAGFKLGKLYELDKRSTKERQKAYAAA